MLGFADVWSPDTDRNPITSERIIHLSSGSFLTSIQCAVTPRKAAFVVSTVHMSIVVETLPGDF